MTMETNVKGGYPAIGIDNILSASRSMDVKDMLKLSSRNRVIFKRILEDPEVLERLKQEAEKRPLDLVSLYCNIRFFLPKGVKETLRKIVARSLVKLGAKTFTRISRGARRFLADQPPGELDVEETIENLLEKGGKFDNLSIDDFMFIKPYSRRIGVVAILDLSGSMTGLKISVASVICAVIAFKARSGQYGIVGFDTEPYILKPSWKNIPPELTIEKILDSTTGGYTNIASALKLARKELRYIKAPQKFAVLITDGAYNVGGDPRTEASKFRRLHVVGIGSKNGYGNLVCKDVAQVGGGKYIPTSTDFWSVLKAVSYVLSG